MTVKQLIEALKTMPIDAQVQMPDGNDLVRLTLSKNMDVVYIADM